MKKFVLLLAVLALVFVSVSPALAASGGMGTVTVVHGVPGLVVDVYVNGSLALPNFAPYTVTDPISLPEGNYNIVIVPAGGNPANPAISGSAYLPAGANVSIVAHLTADGAPTLSVYVNNLKGLKPWETRLVVRHDAAAPTVDVKLARPGWDHEKRSVTVRGLSNPNEATYNGLPGRYVASIAPAGTDQTVFGPAPLTLKPRIVTIVYAVGSLADGTFRLLTQKISTR